MKKKVEKFAASIITSNTEKFKHLCGTIAYNGRYYVSDGYRVLEVEYPIPGFPVITNDQTGKSFEDVINKVEEGNKTIHNLPTAEVIKNGIRNLVGRKRDPVALRIAGDSEPSVYPAVNARYLAEAIQALNCAVCYFDESERFKFMYLFEEDWLQSTVRHVILPINVITDETGFWVIHNENNN